MPTLPPTVTIDGTDTLRAYSELSQQALTRYADDLANQAARLHSEIEELLKSEGLDGPAGMFSALGHGSTANATATGFVKLAKRVADQAEATAKLQRALHLYWLKNIKTPVDAAKAARERGRRAKLKV